MEDHLGTPVMGLDRVAAQRQVTSANLGPLAVESMSCQCLSQVGQLQSTRLHHLVGGSTGPGFSLFRFHQQEKNKASSNETSFVRDKCCYLMLCLFPMEPHLTNTNGELKRWWHMLLWGIQVLFAKFKLKELRVNSMFSKISQPLDKAFHV